MAEAEERIVGFECDFVEAPPDYFQTKCPICLHILREPYQVTCCGKSLCKGCLEQVKPANKSCPLCKQDDYNDFPNKGLQQPLYGMQICCSNKRDGCEWVGELGQLDNHLNVKETSEGNIEHKGCRFAKIKCSDCSEIIIRDKLQLHKDELCLKRPFSCEYCNNCESTYEDIIYYHWPVCGSYPVKCPNQCNTRPQRKNFETHVARDCPLTVVGCDFSYVGCEVRVPRKDLADHIEHSLVAHFSMLAFSYKKTARRIQS